MTRILFQLLVQQAFNAMHCLADPADNSHTTSSGRKIAERQQSHWVFLLKSDPSPPVRDSCSLNDTSELSHSPLVLVVAYDHITYTHTQNHALPLGGSDRLDGKKKSDYNIEMNPN